jgi:hypothetical protein
MPASNPAYSSPSYTATPITGDRLATLAPAAVRSLWKRGVEVFENQNDFWKPFEGNSPMALIQTETDLSKGAGQTMTFTNRSGLYGEPHMGEERFTDSSHYEELKMGTNSLSVDWFRHGVEYTERAEEAMGMRGEIVNGLPTALGEWAGRLKSEKISMMFREQIPAENKIDLGGPLTWEAIVNYAAMMRRWGAASAMVPGMVNGQKVRRYCVIAPDSGLTHLETDADFLSAVKTTNISSAAQTYFDGGFTDVRGHRIIPYADVEHDGYGAIGSPMSPMARLGTALQIVTASYSSPQYIVGGGADYDANDILVKPMKFFPGYNYKVQAGVTLTGSTDSYYVAIVNPPGAATVDNPDPGKFGFYKIGDDQTTPLTINNGVKLAIEDALVDGTTVVAHAKGTGPKLSTTIGSYAWSASLHSNTHPVGSLVVLVHADAVPRFCTFILGAAAARRGYGKYRNNRTFDGKEGNFVRNVYFNTVMGQSVRTNRQGRAPGVIALWHKGTLAGTSLPTP